MGKRKKWLIGFGIVIFLISTSFCVKYLYFDSQPQKTISLNQMERLQSFVIDPKNEHSDVFILNVDGYSNSNYSLKVELFYFPYSKPNLSKVLSFPAGDMHFKYRADFYAGRNKGKVVVTYLPISDKNAAGNLKLGLSIY